MNSEELALLRNESREALSRLGVDSNPFFTNGNIISGLIRALDLPFDRTHEQEAVESSGEVFRDRLGQALGLEVPISTDDVLYRLRFLPRDT